MPKVYRTGIASEADLRVCVTDIRSEADLIVFETLDAWAATEAPIWFYTDIQSEADKTIYVTDSPWDADLVIYKTEVQPDANWAESTKADLL